MSVVGLFTNSRPAIGGLFFDAVLDESSELTTEVTEFPIEDGSVGNDHAVQRPLMLTMRVGVSDNVFRAARAAAADVGGPIAGAASSVGGALAGTAGGLIGSNAAEVGLALSVANAAFAAGQASTRSQTALEAIRDIQRRAQIITVVGAKATYDRMMIVSTRQETTKENEQSLVLVVELQQILEVTSQDAAQPIPAPNDPAATQAQPTTDLGLVVPQ